MCVVVSLFLGLTVSAEEIIKDRQILKREAFLNLSKFSYLNSKVIMLFMISAIQTLSFVVIGNLMLEIQGITLVHWLILFTTSCFANMLGLNISASLNSVVTIYILIPFIIVPELLFSGTMVRFEKLHKSFANYKYVPFIGDIMTSRWAYEALAVYQFKTNKFQKNFFDSEQMMSEASFITNFQIPKLENKLNRIDKYLNDEENKNTLIKDFELLNKEFSVLSKKSKEGTFGLISKLTLEDFDKKILQQAQFYLKKIKKEYNKKYSIASRKKDKRFKQMIKELGSKSEIDKLKDKYYNQNLANFVLNKQELNKIHETDGRLIQLMEPIYRIPESNYGRAHLYSPVKILLGKSFDTYWYNIIFIWFTTLMLYIILLFDGLRKLLTFFESISFKKSKK